MFEIIIQFLIGVLTPIIFIGGIIAVLNELIQSFEKKEEYNRKLEELEEEIKEFSSQNQTLVEDCKSTIREIELEHQKLYSPCPDVHNHYTMRQTLFLKTHMT